MEKILIFYTPIFEEVDTYTKIIQSIIFENSNKKIFIAKCDGKMHLKNCVSNYKAENYKCLICKDKLSKLSYQNENLIVLRYNESSYENEKFNDVRELKNLKYRGINIGTGVHSAAISIIRSHEYSVSFNKKLIESIINTSKKTIDFLFENKNHNFKKIYVFNGRVSHFNAVVEFSKHFKIDFFTFEIANNKKNFLLVKNAIPHSRKIYNEDLTNSWHQSDKTKRERIGMKYFSNEKSKKYNLIDYSSFQVRGNIPKEIKSLNKVITIFGSSRNEYESIEGWKNEFLSGDDEEIIKEVCKNFKHINFVYRAHPNLKLKRNTQTKNIENLKKIKNLLVYDQYSKISTYELIEISEKIIVFATTLGVEATFMNKPVISLGPSIYEALDISYRPKNLIELKELLDDEDLGPKPREEAIKFGYYELTRGIPLNKKAIDLNLKLNFYMRFNVFISKLLNVFRTYNMEQFLSYLSSLNDKRIRNQIIKYFFNKNH